MTDVKIPVNIAEEYASQYFNKEKEINKWLIVRNAWLDGLDQHRLIYPEM